MSIQTDKLIPEELQADTFSGKGLFSFGDENRAYADFLLGQAT